MKQLILILFQLVFMAGIPLIGQTNLTVNNAGELESSVNSASGDVVITFASGFVSGNVNITQPNVNVTVDGGNFIWSTGVIKVSGSGTGTLIVKNLKMDGATATQRLFAGSGSNGKLILKRMEFYNSKHGAIDISTSGNASTVISYTKIYDNTAANSASAVWVGASTNLVINNSTIENNIGTGAGYQCGAIASNFHTGTLEINNTIFRNNVNKCVFSGIFGGGGGAMSLHYLKGSVTINRSLFQGNKTNGEGISVAKTYDGGAIYVFDGRDGAKININNTTFDGNLAYDDGGALMIQGTGKPGLTTTITNCTFYKNIGYGLDGGNVSGGAIQFFKNGGSSVMSNTILGCTFVGNESGTQSSTVSQQGGAIALSGAGTFATASVTYNATLFIGNKVYDSTGQLNTASNYKDISNNTGEQLGARNIINADKGSAPKYTAEDILGESYGLRENLSGIVAGVNDEILKTLPIKPEGIADNTYNGSVTLPATDQRDFGRNKDQGAVEMVWVRFDANGGTWTGLDDNFAYDGLDYYKSTATKASIHYKVSYTGGKVNLPSETLISPVAGQTPKWVIDDGDSDDTNDVEWDPAKTIQENTKVKAVWKSALLKVTYDPNGGKGTAQTVNCAADNTHTILDYRNALLNFTPPIELVFLGWNTLANGSGTMYTVNSVATFTTDTILYAQWIDILEIEGISDVCSDETEMHIPVHIKYAGLPTMEYVMYFCDEAKDVGFVDKTEFSELPHEYIRIKMPERVLSGEYDVEVYIRYKSGTDTVLKTSFEMEITEAIKITRQPVSTAGCEGGNFNLSVEATDNGPDYQWYHDDRKIENATSDSYKGVISSGTAGSYYVELTGFCGTVVSDKVSVTKTEGTQIIRQPVSVTAGCEGGSFDLSVEATGDNLTYQWYHDDRKIENATSDRYEGVISSGTAGSYHVEITGTCGTVTSDKASVTKTEETQITRQPVSVATGCEGGSFNFSVEATGDNLTYQWYHNDRKIENATSNRYNGVISSGSAGSYYVEITGTCGTVTSDKVSVTKTDGAQITRQPVSVATGCEGTSFSLSVEATGQNLTYRWYHNGKKIENATSNRYEGVISSGSAGSYHVEITGTCGTVTSDKVTVSMHDGTKIITQPITGFAGCDNDKFSLEIKAAGNNLTYQWYHNDRRIEGANSYKYDGTISSETVGYYHVVVSGTCGSQTSNKANISLYAKTEIIRHPSGVRGCKGDGFILSAEAAGSSVAYQWYYKDQKIEGATSSRYENTISDKTVGYYRVEVTGACGTLISNKVYVGMNTLTMLMKWNDVLYIENAGNRYAGFQWYRNGQAITQYGTSVYYTDQSGLSGVYFVRAYYAGGTYDESCPMTFTASSLRSAAIAVYPNPVSRSEQLTVKIDEPDVSTEGATIRIYNLTGQKLYSARVTHVETLIPVNLTKGTYLMYITVPDGKETVRKIIVK